MNSRKEPISRQVAILYRQELWAISHLLEEHDVTFSQLPFIMELYSEQGITQDVLALKVQIDKANATRALKQLEKKEFITRERCDSDARAKLVYLTDKARSLKPHLLEIIRKWNEVLTNEISDDEVELMKRVQRKMIKNAEVYRKGV